MQTYYSRQDLQLKELFVVSMVPQSYYFKPNIQTGNLTEALEYIKKQQSVFFTGHCDYPLSSLPPNRFQSPSRTERLQNNLRCLEWMKTNWLSEKYSVNI